MSGFHLIKQYEYTFPYCKIMSYTPRSYFRFYHYLELVTYVPDGMFIPSKFTHVFAEGKEYKADRVAYNVRGYILYADVELEDFSVTSYESYRMTSENAYVKTDEGPKIMLLYEPKKMCSWCKHAHNKYTSIVNIDGKVLM